MVYKLVPFTFIKGGIYYFQRRVPVDLKLHYRAERIVLSLRTRNPRVATSRSLSTANKLDDFWAKMRLKDADVPGKHLLIANEDQIQISGPTMADAMSLYLSQKGVGKPLTFHRAGMRALEYLVGVTGDKPLLAFTKADATRFRDAMFKRQMSSSSVSRLLTTVRATVNFAFSELGISAPNPFTGIYLQSGIGVSERKPLPMSLIRETQKRCRMIDDELRWLVSLISDTGMRLAEATGLAIDDIVLDTEIPYVRVKPHEWRSLKNKGSERTIPLVGEALWAAERIRAETSGRYAFPRYTKNGRTNANSASAALNKWLSVQCGGGYSMHSFRHSLRDRLRAVECPADLIDQIGGWTTAGQGQAYGEGYPLKVVLRWMKKLEGGLA
jgi:integrase